MAESWAFGNATEDGSRNRHWFLGPYIEDPAGLRRTGHLEVKWAVHPKGQRRESWAPGGASRTISMLVRGRFRLDFRRPADPEFIESVVLEREGDYVIWTPEVEHTWAV